MKGREAMRLLPEQRRSMVVDAVRRGFTKTLIAAVYNVSRKTVMKWSKRAYRHGRASYKDKKPERSDSKITLEVELTRLAYHL